MTHSDVDREIACVDSTEKKIYMGEDLYGRRSIWEKIDAFY